MKKDKSPNFILHAKSDEFHWEGVGQLSIKTFSGGRALYKTNKGFFAVEENRYLVLNEGDYTIAIDEVQEVESFCLFFHHGFAEEVYRTLTDTSDQLLTDPDRDKESLGFFEKTYEMSPGLFTLLQNMKQQYPDKKHDRLWLEEQFHQTMQHLLSAHQLAGQEMEPIQMLRSSTKEELYRRVAIADEFIRAFYKVQIQLKDIAQTACMSTNHLLRCYKQVYGKTPHQQLAELRMLEAKKQLANVEWTITDIGLTLGFQSPASFSKAFKLATGTSPLDYRKKVILDKKSST
ncbi:AraC family transcriptional regulator [Sporosarcina sp. Te-1]|uniref:helix-turn-helix domain-containing protein n=1 Tax=Sporosarcina sp. Te-1 TaxID=2818390 RepID=UPI001A9DBA71|nr:AraC family transcriptional regulator [Sporosarcina sp. Te-1]QTD40043.1 helix-turn-helix transcriptional regulator [Sporosarcina sp. Te-1]